MVLSFDCIWNLQAGPKERHAYKLVDEALLICLLIKSPYLCWLYVLLIRFKEPYQHWCLLMLLAVYILAKRTGQKTARILAVGTKRLHIWHQVPDQQTVTATSINYMNELQFANRFRSHYFWESWWINSLFVNLDSHNVTTSWNFVLPQSTNYMSRYEKSRGTPGGDKTRWIGTYHL